MKQKEKGPTVRPVSQSVSQSVLFPSEIPLYGVRGGEGGFLCNLRNLIMLELAGGKHTTSKDKPALLHSG